MMTPFNILAVALGGGLGASLRFLTSHCIAGLLPDLKFPLGTFLINVIGCTCIGLVVGLSTKHEVSDTFRIFIVTGILGGFTTFSAFGLETVTLVRGGHFIDATAYIVGSVALGCLAVFVSLLATESKLLTP